MNIGPPGLDRFWEKLKQACGRVLLLDYDGTLAPFNTQREQAFPYPGVRELLDKIIYAGHSRVVLISGRAVDDLVPLLGLNKLPEIFGSHGAEHLTTGGDYQIKGLDERTRSGLQDALKWAEAEGLQKRVEQKPAGLALHWRGLDEPRVRGLKARVQAAWDEITSRSVLELHEFDGGLELRPRGITKADAVLSVLSEEPEAQAAYLGDDRTDEDAFRAIKGKGLAVLVRERKRETSADIWIKPPEGLIEFLKTWDAASRQECS